jgi:hypothetical protein
MVHTSVGGLRKTLLVHLPGSDWVIPASADKTEIYRCLTILYVRPALDCVGIHVANSRRPSRRGEMKSISFLQGYACGFQVRIICRSTD